MEVNIPSDCDPDENRMDSKNINPTTQFNYKLTPQNHGYHRKMQVVRRIIYFQRFTTAQIVQRPCTAITSVASVAPRAVHPPTIKHDHTARSVWDCVWQL